MFQSKSFINMVTKKKKGKKERKPTQLEIQTTDTSPGFQALGIGLQSLPPPYSALGPTPSAPTLYDDSPLKIILLSFKSEVKMSIQGDPLILTQPTITKAFSFWKYYCTCSAQWNGLVGMSIVQCLRLGSTEFKDVKDSRMIRSSHSLCTSVYVSNWIQQAVSRKIQIEDLEYEFTDQGKDLLVSLYVRISPLSFPTPPQSYPSSDETIRLLTDYGVALEDKDGSIFLH